MLINKFDLTLVGKPEDVGMKTGATIHTMNGLNMKVSLKPDEIPETNDCGPSNTYQGVSM